MRQKLISAIILVLALLLPTQFGKHFFLDASYIDGIRVDYLALKVYATDILVVFLILLSADSIVRFIRQHKKLILGVLLLSGINILMVDHKMIGVYTLVKYLEVFFLGVSIYVNAPNIKRLMGVFAIGAFFELSLSVAQMATRSSVEGLFYYLGERSINIHAPSIAKLALGGVEILRPYGTFSHPNSLGGFFLVLYSWVLFQKKQTFWGYVLLFCSSMLVLISFSKAAILGFLLITFLHVFNYTKTTCAFCKVGRLLGVLILSFIFASGSHGAASITERITTGGRAIALFIEYPFFGVGIGQHLYVLSQLPSKTLYFVNQPIHSIFLIALVEWGSILFLLVGYGLFLILRKREISVYVVFFSIALTGLFDHYWVTLQQNMLLVGFIGGILLNKTNSSQRNEPV